VASLPLRLGNGRKFGTVNPEAYDLYMRAESLGMMDGLPLLEEAVVKDPSFAVAHASLASALAYRTGSWSFDLRTDLPRMRAAALRAVQLDPLLPEAHSALGMSLARDGKWDEAEKSFRRAIALNPNRSETYGEFSVYVLMQEERIPEAVEQMNHAQKSDPLSPEVISELAYVLLSAHRYDEAAAECQKLPEDCHCWPAPTERVRYECLGRARIGQGRLREAIEILSEGVKGASIGAPMRGYLALALGRAGQTAKAEKFIETDWKNPYHQALAYIGLGDKSRAIDAMERMEPNGPVRVGLALAVPELDSIRDDPRTKALRARLGLPR
jgi:serine/threonine-protein kinase